MFYFVLDSGKLSFIKRNADRKLADFTIVSVTGLNVWRWQLRPAFPLCNSSQTIGWQGIILTGYSQEDHVSKCILMMMRFFLLQVEYDLMNSTTDDVRLLSSERIEQSATPQCFTWYPPIVKENFLVVAKDQVGYTLLTVGWRSDLWCFKFQVYCKR